MKHLLLFQNLPTLGRVLHELGGHGHHECLDHLHLAAVPAKEFDTSHMLARLWCSMLLRNLSYHFDKPTVHTVEATPPWESVPIVEPCPDSVRDGSAFGLTAQAMLGTDWRRICVMGATTHAKNAGVGAQSR